MPTCKDCVHVDVCREYAKDNLTSLAMSPAEIQMALTAAENKPCDRFKDRSLFVQLPCNVGDTVYMIVEHTEKVGRKKVTNNNIVECGVDNFRIGDAGYPSAALCDVDNNWYYGIEPSNFGDFVFLTREAAEQALKEQKNG